MAEEFRSLRSLREANLILLSRLHVSQKAIWNDVNSIKTNHRSREIDKPSEESIFEGFGPDRTPVTMRRRKALSELSTKITPRKQGERSNERFSTPRRTGEKENRVLSMKKDGLNRINSILRTPKSQSKRQKVEGEQHVKFQPSTPTVKKPDHSCLGYDWIAGMLDNDSHILQKDDSFFNDLQDFRRVNRSECTGSSIPQNPTKSPLPKWQQPERFHDEKCHKCSDTYVLDDRLFAVPIHGAGSYCTLCKTHKPAEYENQDCYVRISVPRSTLQSPHRVKPHRRKSFDPTDTVSLSKHCLLGWHSSQPALVPSQSAIDLRAHTGISKLNSLNWSNPSLQTSEPLRSHSGFLRGRSYETDR